MPISQHWLIIGVTSLLRSLGDVEWSLLAGSGYVAVNLKATGSPETSCRFSVLGLFLRSLSPRDLRNLLAQGYVPVLGSDGHTVYLVQSARAVSGGVAFTF
jgi:hypothetical protein